MAAPPRVAFTGFGPFPGVPDNPSGRLIAALCDSRDLAFAGCCFDVLDVAYAAVGPALDRILARAPRALVMTGFSRHATGVTLECVATDHCAATLPDAAGFVPPGPGATDASAEVTRLACPHIDLPSLADSLVAAGFPATLSEDAGSYVCNHMLFTALERLAGTKTPALFVHVPALPESPLAETSAGTMPLDALVRAMALIANRLAP